MHRISPATGHSSHNLRDLDAISSDFRQVVNLVCRRHWPLSVLFLCISARDGYFHEAGMHLDCFVQRISAAAKACGIRLLCHV